MTKRWKELDPRLKQNESKRHDYLAGEIDKRGGEGGGPEEDPVFSSSPAGRITDSDLTNWNKKYDKAELKGNCILFYNNNVEVKRICLDSSFSTKEYTMNSIRSALESMDELYCKVVASLPVIGDENTFYLKRASDTFDIYFYEYQNHIPVGWCHVGGSTVSEEYVRSLVSDKLSANDIKKINNKNLLITGDQDNLTKKDLGIPTKVGELDNDMQYVRMNDALIRVNKEDDESNYRYIFRQGSRGQVYQSIEFPKFQLSKAEVVTDPEGYDEGDYLHLQFGNGDNVYIPISNIVGAVYEGLPRKFREGETAEKIGTYLNNVNVSIDGSKISADFSATPSDEERAEYLSKKGVEFPYHTTKQWHDMVKLAMTDVLDEIAKMSEDEILEDTFVKELDSAIGAIGTAAAIIGIVSNMTCSNIKRKFNDLFTEEDDPDKPGEKKWKMNDDNIENTKQDKLYDVKTAGILHANKINFRVIESADEGEIGETKQYSFLQAEDGKTIKDPIHLGYKDIGDRPNLMGKEFTKDMNPRDYALQVLLSPDNDSGIWLKDVEDPDSHAIIGSRISTYAPDMKTIIFDDERKLKFAEKQVEDKHCVENSITGRVIAKGSIRGGTNNNQGTFEATGHIAPQSIDGGNIASGSIKNNHLDNGIIDGNKLAYKSIQGYTNEDNPGHIALNTIKGKNIESGQVELKHFTDETLQKIKESVNDVKLGDLEDSNGDKGISSYHFQKSHKDKLDALKLLENNIVLKEGLDDSIVFREGNDGKYNIQLDSRFKTNLESKVQGLDVKYTELDNSFKGYKEKCDADLEKMKMKAPQYPAINSTLFDNASPNPLSFTKQNGIVFISGTIYSKTEIGLGTKNILNDTIPDDLTPVEIFRKSISIAAVNGFYFANIVATTQGQLNISNIRDSSGVSVPLPADTQININMLYTCTRDEMGG